MRKLHYKALLGVLIGCLLFSFSHFSISTFADSDLPTQIHVTSESTTFETLTVIWRTLNSDSGDKVVFDTVTRANIVDYATNVTGEHFAFTDSGFIHQVELTGLAVNTTYFFKCGGDTGGFSEEYTVKTPPQNSLHFVVGGDPHRFFSATKNDTAFVIEEFSKIAAENPDFFLILGDVVQSGSDQTRWDRFFDKLFDLGLYQSRHIIPIFTVIGNHEDNNSRYYDYFAYPTDGDMETEQWYYYDFNCIRIIVLDSNIATGDKLDRQLDFLEDALNITKSVIVCAHYNNYQIDDMHPDEFDDDGIGLYDYNEPVIELLGEYNATLMLTGHSHAYQRTIMLKNNEEVTENGTVFITSGGLADNDTDDDDKGYWWYSACVRDPRLFYSVVDINSTHIELESKDFDATTFDYLTLNNSGAIVTENEPTENETTPYTPDSNGGSGHTGEDSGSNGNNDGSTSPPPDAEPIAIVSSLEQYEVDIALIIIPCLLVGIILSIVIIAKKEQT